MERGPKLGRVAAVLGALLTGDGIFEWVWGDRCIGTYFTSYEESFERARNTEGVRFSADMISRLSECFPLVEVKHGEGPDGGRP